MPHLEFFENCVFVKHSWYIQVFMFGTVSKWIGVYNIWYYGVFMALNGRPWFVNFVYIIYHCIKHKSVEGIGVYYV